MGLLSIPLAILFVLLMLFLGAAAVLIAIVREMPWLLVLAGVWLLLRTHFGSGHGRRAGPRPVRTPPRTVTHPTPPPAAQRRPPPVRPEGKPRRELPIDLQVKVDQIQRKADLLLGYADRFPPFSQDLHLVRQTAAEYLPGTTGAYLALPGDGDPPIDATGKTALQELREQLQLLDSKLDDIAQDLQRQDLDRLLANRRFLEQRFRQPEREPPIRLPRQETDVA
jgi:hypothetical protein